MRAIDIRHLLEDRADAVGLAVREMPLGSPRVGRGSRRKTYSAYLIRHDGATEAFTSYPGNWLLVPFEQSPTGKK